MKSQDEKQKEPVKSFNKIFLVFVVLVERDRIDSPEGLCFNVKSLLFGRREIKTIYNKNNIYSASVWVRIKLNLNFVSQRKSFVLWM